MRNKDHETNERKAFQKFIKGNKGLGHVRVRKKPVEVEAICYTGGNYEAVCRFAAMKLEQNEKGQLLIPTLEGTMRASKGDYVIKGLKGELYPIKPQIFYETYELLE